jgi:hypothetical protein
VEDQQAADDGSSQTARLEQRLADARELLSLRLGEIDALRAELERRTTPATAADPFEAHVLHAVRRLRTTKAWSYAHRAKRLLYRLRARRSQPA